MSLHVSKEHDQEFARIAYQAVEGIPTVEVNDRNRLGYHVWLYLRGELPTLEDAVKLARSRFRPKELSRDEVVQMIRAALPGLNEPNA